MQHVKKLTEPHPLPVQRLMPPPFRIPVEAAALEKRIRRKRCHDVQVAPGTAIVFARPPFELGGIFLCDVRDDRRNGASECRVPDPHRSTFANGIHVKVLDAAVGEISCTAHGELGPVEPIAAHGRIRRPCPSVIMPAR